MRDALKYRYAHHAGYRRRRFRRCETTRLRAEDEYWEGNLGDCAAISEAQEGAADQEWRPRVRAQARRQAHDTGAHQSAPGRRMSAGLADVNILIALFDSVHPHYSA